MIPITWALKQDFCLVDDSCSVPTSTIAWARPIWQGCKILDQHSQYSHIVYHTTRKIDIQNSFPTDISRGSSNFILDGGTSQSIWHLVSSGGSPLQRASGHCHRGPSKSRHRSCWESTCHRRGVDYGAFVVLSQMNIDLFMKYIYNIYIYTM